jgi:hypothetical protein
MDAEQFTEDLERRRQAADSLEKDLLNDVPLLYGSAELGRYVRPPCGDPGVVIARIHREDMLRRNGYDVSDASGPPAEVSLPFERATEMLAVLLFLILLSLKMH